MGKRIVYMDLLTCFSALFVVFLHSTLTVFNFRTDASWFESLFIQSFFHWPVPVFFMLSGANLLGYRQRYSTRIFFNKRIKRVVIPFLIWSLIWLIYDFGRGIISNLSLKHVVNLFVYNGIQNNFWFFYAIIFIYICLPILSLLAKKENKKVVLFFILLCLLQNGVFHFLFGVFRHPVSPYFSFPVAGTYLSYVLTGWYLVNFPLKKMQRILIYIAGAASGGLMFAGTYYFSFADRRLNILFMDYNSLFTFFLSVSVFVLFQSINWDKIFSARMVRFITIMSSTSFGVYIIHRMIISEMNHYFNLNATSLYYMTLFPIFIYALSVLVVYLMKRTPVIKHIMP
ncbi:acyltransferase [Sporolactobacillus pectinivorans]|uniref:acyltransferase n=1 Tax=Sporolactobacillus pectinivorans TaxID=1591408 RepID=UPI000C2590AC|nr:acyltransferase family protein [Sporolactobacillus pectinivorans]